MFHHQIRTYMLAATMALCALASAASAENLNISLAPSWTPPPGADDATIAARKPWMEKVNGSNVLHIDMPTPSQGQTYTAEQMATMVQAVEDLTYLPEYDAPDNGNLGRDIANEISNVVLAGDVTLNRGALTPGATVVSAPVVFKNVRRLDADMKLKTGGFKPLLAGTMFVSFDFTSDKDGKSPPLVLWCAESKRTQIFNVYYPAIICFDDKGGTTTGMYTTLGYGGKESGIPLVGVVTFEQDISLKPVWHDIDPKDFTVTFSLTYEGSNDKGLVFHKHISRVVDGKTLVNNSFGNQTYPNGKFVDAPFVARSDGLYLYSFPTSRLYFTHDMATDSVTVSGLKNYDVRPEFRGDPEPAPADKASAPSVP